MGSKILVVDDEREIADVVELYLKNENYQVVKCYNGRDALEAVEKEKPDLALLDVMLPDIDGFTILQKINGLTLGADDYIAKPFNPLELMARVKAQLRRSTKYNEGNRSQEDIIDFGGLFLNRNTHECIYNERELTLTPIEFDILWILCENRGQVISSEQLFEQVWKEKYYKNSNNTVMVHIRHLREKMSGPTGKSDFIKTVWGVGYRVEK